MQTDTAVSLVTSRSSEKTAIRMPALTRALSSERMSAFREVGDSDRDTAARYAWNIALGMAMTPLLHCIEVTLRNAIFHAGALCYPNPRRYHHVPCWLDMYPSVLDSEDEKAVSSACIALHRRAKQRTSGRLIAELGFGFWVSLLRRPYDQGRAKGTGSGFALWTAANLKQSFPNLSSRFRTRESIHSRFEEARLFRNRISHHEPIFHKDIEKLHGEFSRALAWMNLDAYRAVDAFDDTIQLLRVGPRIFRTRCHDLLGT
jgi:hypothetical protein